MEAHLYTPVHICLLGSVKVQWVCSYVTLFEGCFFAKALFTRSGQDEDDEDQLSFKKNDLLMVKDTGQDNMWEGTMLSTGNHGLVPVNAMQPLPYPFYQ